MEIHHFDPSSDDLGEFFQLPTIKEWIEGNGYERIALQFPQNYHGIAPEIYVELEKRLRQQSGGQRQLFILADTSYRSCCLDEIGAEHANCDAIVHFGDTCSSQGTGKIPALHIFVKQKIDFDGFKERICAAIGTMNFDGQTVLILCDSSYSQLEDEIGATIKPAFSASTNCHVCKLLKPPSNPSEEGDQILGRRLPHGYVACETDLLIFIGARESPLLTLFRLSVPNLRRVLHYVPEENCAHYSEVPANKMLMKRLYLVEKVRDARTIGLVIGSASLHGCREAIARIRQLCKRAEKKLYVLHIGKLNEAKLTNFAMEVDIFVMLSCPYGILLDENKFYRPVVSMIEAEMALNREDDCYANLKWTAELQKILENEIHPLESAMADFSLTSGTVRSNGKSMNGEVGGDDGKQLVGYCAGDNFAQRTWKGLEDGQQQSQAAKLQKGRDGIASRYEEEPTTSK